MHTYWKSVAEEVLSQKKMAGLSPKVQQAQDKKKYDPSLSSYSEVKD